VDRPVGRNDVKDVGQGCVERRRHLAGTGGRVGASQDVPASSAASPLAGIIGEALTGAARNARHHRSRGAARCRRRSTQPWPTSLTSFLPDGRFHDLRLNRDAEKFPCIAVLAAISDGMIQRAMDLATVPA